MQLRNTNRWYTRYPGLRKETSPAPRRGRRPTLEFLEDRTVPTVVDLTTVTQGVINDALFRRGNTSPAGSGVLHSFVRIAPGGSATQEQGYNTGHRPISDDPVLADVNSSATFTRNLPL